MKNFKEYDTLLNKNQKQDHVIFPELKSQGKIDTAPHLYRPMDEIINHGLENVGMYHAKRPLIKDKAGNLVTEDMSLLYFYHNRLHGYGLEKLF